MTGEDELGDEQLDKVAGRRAEVRYRSHLAEAGGAAQRIRELHGSARSRLGSQDNGHPENSKANGLEHPDTVETAAKVCQ